MDTLNSKPLKVLVACEESQAVCIEFRKRGHEAYSCDVLPCSGGRPEWHIQDDVLNVLKASDIIKNFISDKPCAKQTTVAVIINGDNYWTGSNYCDYPQSICPRKDMATGVGYELCKTICKQHSHAEVDACIKAGNKANGGTLYLGGHYYACDNCKKVAEEHGIKQIVILPKEGWDMMIAFPPCTHLAVSGARWFDEKRKDGRQQYAINFFMMIANMDCERIAIENPIGIMSTEWRKPDQIIQPWMFGHGETKATCLWLKNLPKLVPTNIVEGREQRIWKIPPSKDRAVLRSRTFHGVAQAMASQWSEDLGFLNTNTFMK